MTTISEAFVTIRPDTKDFGRDAESGIRKGATLLAGAGLALGAAAGLAISKGLEGAINTERANDKLAAGLLLTQEESERIGRVAGGLFRDAYGDSLEEVNGAISGVAKNMVDLGSVSDDELGDITAAALDLATVMDEDVGRVTRAAGQLMRNDLAPNAQAAFDIIARAQSGAAGATDDLIDTIEEYATDFHSLGLTGEMAMAMIEEAMERGARNTDLAADAIREFSIRAVDGSKTTREAFALLGLDADEMAGKIAAGGPVAREAMSTIIQELGKVGSKVEQEQIGVALFGTRFEELGADIVLAMDPATAALDGVEGASGRLSDTLNDNLGTSWESLKRQAKGALDDALRPLATWLNEEGIPKAKEFFGLFKNGLDGKDRIVGDFGEIQQAGIALDVPVDQKLEGWEKAAFNLGVEMGKLGGGIKRFAKEDAIPALDEVGKTYEAMSPVINPVMDEIANRTETGFRIVGGSASTLASLLRGDFSGAWEDAKGVVSATWDGMRTSAENGKSLIEGTLTVLNTMTGGKMGEFFGIVSGAGERAKNAFTASISVMVGDVRDAFNRLISGINWVIGKINDALDFTVPGVDLPGAMNAIGIPDIPSFSVDTPNIGSIPYLAEGGIVRARPGGTVVNVGEGGKDEAVIPLDGRFRGGGIGDVYGDLVVVLPGVRTGNDFISGLDRMAASAW
ncbi:MAG: phage tail tape measure protein [Dehalococcoidia bacterium]